jgi:hypothetical protein
VKCRYDRVFGEGVSQAQVFEHVKPAIAQVTVLPKPLQTRCSRYISGYT